MLCDHLEGWDREGGREIQEGGDMGIYVYIFFTNIPYETYLSHTLQERTSKENDQI